VGLAASAVAEGGGAEAHQDDGKENPGFLPFIILVFNNSKNSTENLVLTLTSEFF
jgi:hypothetical protein